MTLDTKTFAGFSSALIAVIIAIIGAYITLDRKVTALAATSPTGAYVEHIVDLKTASRLDEILRRLNQIDSKLEQIQHQRVDARQAKEQP